MKNECNKININIKHCHNHSKENNTFCNYLLWLGDVTVLWYSENKNTANLREPYFVSILNKSNKEVKYF